MQGATKRPQEAWHEPRRLRERREQRSRGGFFGKVLEPFHHPSKSGAHLLYSMAVVRIAELLEILFALFVVLEEFLRAFAGLDFLEHFFPFLLGLFIDDAGPAREVAVLGRIGHALAHALDAG